MYFFNVLKDFIKHHPFMVLSNMAFMLLIPVNEILLPHIYGKILEAIQTQKNFMSYFIFLIIIIIIIQLGHSLGDWHDTYINPAFQSFVRQSMLNTIFEKYENNYEDIAAGDIITKFVKAPTIIIDWFKNVKDYLIPYMLVIVFATIYFLSYDIILGLCLLVAMTFVSILIIIAPRKCINETLLQSKAFDDLHEDIEDILRNMMSVYGSDQKTNELNRIYKMDMVFKDKFAATMKCVLKYKVFAIPLIITFFVIFVLRCNYLIQNKRMKSSNFVSLFMIILYMMSTLMWMVDITRNIIFDWGNIERTQMLLDFKRPIPKELDVKFVLPEEGVGLYNVTFTYDGSIEPALNNMTIHFKPGERTVLLGDIGSGKSTILKLLMQYYIPSQGDLFINGQWYSTLGTYQIRRHIGYIPQNPILFNRSLYDNIKYGNADLTNDEIDRTLNKLGIMSEFTNLEKGLNTLLGKNGSKLSGGQRQLVWCLRVLLSDPDVILMDEFTSAMDEKTKELVSKILDIMMVGKTIVMVTHDPYLMKFANRKVNIKDGRVIV